MNPYYYPSPTPTPSGNIRTSISTPIQPNGVEEDTKDRTGQIAQGAIGLLNMGADWATIANQGLGLNGREAPSTNAYAGDFYNHAANAQIQKLSGGEVVGGVGKGALTGFKVGGPLGAAIGAGIGGLGTIFASKRRRKRQSRERDAALSQALSYQSDYNDAQNSADQQAATTADYQRRLDNYNQNLYSWTAI